MRTDISSTGWRGRRGQGALVLPAQVGCSQVSSEGWQGPLFPQRQVEPPRDLCYNQTRVSESPMTRLQHPSDAVPCGRGPEAGRGFAGLHAQRPGQGLAFPQPLSPVLGQNQGVQLWSRTPKLCVPAKGQAQLRRPAT